MGAGRVDGERGPDGSELAATANRDQRCTRCVGSALVDLHDARLQCEELRRPVDRELLGRVTIDDLLGGRLVARSCK